MTFDYVRPDTLDEAIAALAGWGEDAKVLAGGTALVLMLQEGLIAPPCVVDIGRMAGRKVVALISDMNQPLGHAVGNALEVREAIDTLAGGGPPDFREHCLHVAAHMLVLAGHAPSLRAARALAEKALESGAAREKFRALVAAQGGDPAVIDDPARLPKAPVIEMVRCEKGGYLAQADARLIGMTAVALGAGRARKGDPIDPAVGIVVHAKVGDRLRPGSPLYTLHASDAEHLRAARQQVAPAFKLVSRAIPPLPLFYRTVR